MNWSKFIRQSHRWLSMTFTVTMIILFVALAVGEPAEWVYYLPLYPLLLLFFSGLYLFVLPHTARWRANRRTVRPN